MPQVNINLFKLIYLSKKTFYRYILPSLEFNSLKEIISIIKTYSRTKNILKILPLKYYIIAQTTNS